MDSVNHDQMPHSVASDLGLHCFLRPGSLNIKDEYGSLVYCSVV